MRSVEQRNEDETLPCAVRYFYRVAMLFARIRPNCSSFWLWPSCFQSNQFHQMVCRRARTPHDVREGRPMKEAHILTGFFPFRSASDLFALREVFISASVTSEHPKDAEH